MHPRIVVLAAAVIAGTLPLSSIAQADNGKLDPDQAQAARKAIVAWLECKDCTEKDLRSILLYKDAPGFVASLAAALHNGPSPASREAYRQHLSRSYDEMVDFSAKNPRLGPPSMSRDRYIDLYMGNYVAHYQIQAARVLVRKGGDQAKRALESAIELPLREDVKQFVQQALLR